MSLRRRVEALERQQRQVADRLDQLMRDDPRWANPEFRRNVREWDQRLRDEARTLDQVRQATRVLLASLSGTAVEPERDQDESRRSGRPPMSGTAVPVFVDATRRHT